MIFRRKNKFQIHQYIKVWVYAESCEGTVLAVVTGIDGDHVSVRYLDEMKINMLRSRDNTFIFPPMVHFKDCCYLAYDQLRDALRLNVQSRIRQYPVLP